MSRDDYGVVNTEEVLEFLSSDDRLGQVLKGHLAIEVRLGFALEAKAYYPAAFQRMRLSFIRKVQLCVALGLIDESLEPPMMVLNGLRNSLAHDYHSKIERTDADKLINALPAYWRLAPPVQEVLERNTLKDTLFIGMLVLYTVAGHAIKNALDEKNAMAELRRALDEDKRRHQAHAVRTEAE